MPLPTWFQSGCGDLPRHRLESVHVAFLNIDSLLVGSLRMSSSGLSAPAAKT